MDQKPQFNDTQSQELSKAYKGLQEYESILNILPDIIYKIDTEGRFVFLNNTVSMLGFQPDELLGRHFSVLVHPGDIPKVSRKQVLPSFQGKPTGEHKAPKLFDETRTGRRITKNLAVRLIPKFAPQDLVFDAPPAIEGEVIASGTYNRLVHDQAKEFEGTSGRIILKTQAGRVGEIFNGEISTLGKDYQDISERNIGFVGTVGVIRDVTEQKHLEEKNRQLEAQLFDSKKMQAIGEAAGGIAYDFNNLLSIMLGQTEMILKQYTHSDQSVVHSVITIQKAIIQAAELTSKLLTIARRVKISNLPVNLQEVVAEIFHLLSHSFDKSFTLRLELTAGHSTIIGDASLLKNALINVALNARDAMPAGGELIFKTSNLKGETLKARFPDQRVAAEDYIAIAIQDSGLGMDQEVLDRLFEPFFTTKGQGKGTGLGLACVEGIVEMHKGLIDVESVEGVGSTFTIFIPLAKDRITVQPADGLDAHSRQEDRGHILIVDDEPIVLETQTLLLRELGFRVTSFSDSSTAIEYYAQHHGQIDLVILDLNMPILNGKQCFEELKKIRPEVRAIISTGCNVDSEAEGLFKSGIGGLIQKPFPIKKLLQTINDVLGKPYLPH
jgi:two-component system, cell cycle sensor histidine kinase and response regulator CckA